MRRGFHNSLGLQGGVLYSGLEAFLFKGKAPLWTLKHKHAEKEWPRLRGVENRFCPAEVYGYYVEGEGKPLGVRFLVNVQE